MGSTPWVRRHPGVGSGNPFQYSYLENSTVRESVQSEVLDMTEHTRRQHTLDLLLKANCFHVFWLLILFHSLFITQMLNISSWTDAWLLMLFVYRKNRIQIKMKKLDPFYLRPTPPLSHRKSYNLWWLLLDISLAGKMHMSPTMFTMLVSRSAFVLYWQFLLVKNTTLWNSTLQSS